MRIAARSNSIGPWAVVRRREPGVPSGLGNSLLSSRDTKELTRLSSKKPAKTMSRSWRSRHCRTYNCLPKRFLCEKRSRQYPIWIRSCPRPLLVVQGVSSYGSRRAQL